MIDLSEYQTLEANTQRTNAKLTPAEKSILKQPKYVSMKDGTLKDMYWLRMFPIIKEK